MAGTYLDTIDSLGPLGSIIGGGTIPADVTSETLKRRRAIQAAIAAQKEKRPETLGQGIAYLGESIGQRLADDRLTEAEKAQTARDATLRANPAYAAPPAGAVVAPALPASAPAAVAPAPVAAPAPAANTFDGKPYTEVPVKKSEGEALKDKLAALLLGNGAEVPQENPTLAGASQPPQEVGGPQTNVQLASLGGAGGTMTDAPPPGAFRASQPPPVSDAPEPTPTDIKPMPVRTAQMNVPPSGVLPGASIMSSDFNRMPAAAPPPAADMSVPSRTAAPDPGPPPAQPMPTKQMQLLRSIATDPRVGDATKADAAARYADHQKHQEQIYTQQYGLWKDAFEKRRDYLLTGQFDQRIKELQIRQSLAKDPLEIQKLGGEIKAQELAREKSLYEITQRPVEEAQKATTLEQGQRTLAKPETTEIGGRPYERQYDRATKTLGPLSAVPGSPPDEKLTETQAKAYKALQRATVATSIVGDGRELRGFMDTLASKLPVGGNYLLSPEYQRKHSAMMAWGTAVLRDESGAVLSPSEIASKINTFFAQPGDSDQVVAEKAARRHYEEQSLYHSMGDKKSLVDAWKADRATRKTDKPEGFTEKSNLGRVRRVIGGHWVYPDEY